MEDKQNQTSGLMGLVNKNMIMWVVIILVVLLGLWMAKDYIMPKESIQLGLGSPSIIELSQLTMEQGF